MTSFILGVFELTVGMSAFIALLLLTLKLFGNKFTAKCRYILWTLVIIRLAIPFSFGLMPSLIEIPIEPDLLQIEDASGTLVEDMDPLTQNSALSNPDGTGKRVRLHSQRMESSDMPRNALAWKPLRPISTL